MQRLELTWIGKEEQPQVEPRILLHDPSKDYDDISAAIIKKYTADVKHGYENGKNSLEIKLV